ncbi:MAG: two-component system, NarL family, nitrate/nitrite response regulator NarL [Pseudonocardiales bacterium]|jgi:DNA-binding NarL/FixJ family response regulator|nr:two-component system, NarL family, nitrate/nitrite response regulator NarL [Pseudonocardiales bacterium]
MGNAFDVVLADDHVVFLDALSAVLGQFGYEIRATATTSKGLLDAVRALRPALCVTESHFRDGAVVDMFGELARCSPDTRTVVLTADGDPATMRQALDAGACGYVHKTRGVADLLDVLRRVGAGEIVVEGSFVRAVKPSGTAPLELAHLATFLTGREIECLQLLVAGNDTVTMARRLGVCRTTVRSHVQAVLTKLGVHSRLEAAALAVRYGLVESAPELSARVGDAG